MDDCTRAGQVDERRILADAVIGLHLEAPPVGPHRRAGVVFGKQVADLVGLHGVVEGRNLVAELPGDIEHYRHFVTAVAVVVYQDFAAQHPGQRLELEVAQRRLAALGAFGRLYLLLVVGRRDPGRAVARDVAHACSR